MEDTFSKLLLDRFQQGETQAAEEIYARYAQRLLRLAKSRISSALQSKFDADDILQTSFQIFFEKANRDEVDWTRQGDLWRLLAAIALNHIKRQVEHFSTDKRQYSIEMPELPSQLADRAGSHGAAEILESMLHGETRLTSQVASLRLAGFSHAEIAHRIGRSERTVRRIIQMLKAKLATDSAIGLAEQFEIGQKHPQSISLQQDAQQLFQTRYEDFDLLKMIGAGAFGKVYLATNRRNQSLVAVKALRRNWLDNPAAKQLFFNEAQLLAKLDHPNIVKFLGAGPLPNGSWFIVMQWASGQSFAEYLTKFRTGPRSDAGDENASVTGGVITGKIIIQWLVQAADALKMIHELGVTHGDLKPQNILIDQHGTTKLIDFGFADWTVNRHRQRSGGTQGYLAPEETLTSASDMFAFGAILKRVLDAIALNESVEHQLKRLAEQLAQQCPAQRPTAEETLASLRELINSTEGSC